VATITPLGINAAITANDKVYDGNTSAITQGVLSGILAGDSVSLSTVGAFSDRNVGNGKTVNVSGMIAGNDAGNYVLSWNPTTTANITQNASQGASGNAVTQIDALLDPETLATPYGVASNVTVGDYTGNHKKTRQPVEKNVQRSDFNSGLSLQVVSGGVRLPADVMQ